MDCDRCYKVNQYVYYEDHIVVPEAQLDGCLQWANIPIRAQRVQPLCRMFQGESGSGAA